MAFGLLPANCARMGAAPRDLLPSVDQRRPMTVGWSGKTPQLDNLRIDAGASLRGSANRRGSYTPQLQRLCRSSDSGEPPRADGHRSDCPGVIPRLLEGSHPGGGRAPVP
jgi:hypothetical protein